MSYVFGPLWSRRLGRSLGVDPLPFKTCNWNCVYCQLGRSTVLRGERKEHVPTHEVIEEIRHALEGPACGEIDWITFCGSGEPTLQSGLGRMIREVKALTPTPVAVLTNGSCLALPAVRADLLAADAVLPSLDAGSEDLYRRINRPHPQLTLQGLVDGLGAFRRAYRGRLWVEVMLLEGVNDGEEALKDIAAVLERIAPDEVHVSRPSRPPAEAWVRPPDDAALARAVRLLGASARVVTANAVDLSGRSDVCEALAEILARHPMSLEELVEYLRRWSPDEVAMALARLVDGGRVASLTRMGRRFWGSAQARYGEEPSGPRPGRDIRPH